MSDHADTIRRRLMHRNGVTDPEGAAALDALVAERQQAIDALRETVDAFAATAFTEGCERQAEALDAARAVLVSLGETE